MVLENAPPGTHSNIPMVLENVPPGTHSNIKMVLDYAEIAGIIRSRECWREGYNWITLNVKFLGWYPLHELSISKKKDAVKIMKLLIDAG